MAQRSVEDRQDMLTYAVKRIISYAVAKAQKRQDLPASPDWYKWEFSYPAKLTIDDGRITKELETLWRIGAVNMRDIVSMRGKTYEEHITERAHEIAIRKIAAADATKLYGVEIDSREMTMLTPNDQPDAVLAASIQPDETETGRPDRRLTTQSNETPTNPKPNRQSKAE
jgi:hypothetical protein